MMRGQVWRLAAILEACSRGSKVTWSDDAGNLGEGTVRGLVQDKPGYPHHLGDVEDGFVRITTVEGFEMALSVKAVEELMTEGLISFD